MIVKNQTFQDVSNQHKHQEFLEIGYCTRIFSYIIIRIKYRKKLIKQYILYFVSSIILIPFEQLMEAQNSIHSEMAELDDQEDFFQQNQNQLSKSAKLGRPYKNLLDEEEIPIVMSLHCQVLHLLTLNYQQELLKRQETHGFFQTKFDDTLLFYQSYKEALTSNKFQTAQFEGQYIEFLKELSQNHIQFKQFIKEICLVFPIKIVDEMIYLFGLVLKNQQKKRIQFYQEGEDFEKFGEDFLISNKQLINQKLECLRYEKRFKNNKKVSKILNLAFNNYIKGLVMTILLVYYKIKKNQYYEKLITKIKIKVCKQRVNFRKLRNLRNRTKSRQKKIKNIVIKLKNVQKNRKIKKKSSTKRKFIKKNQKIQLKLFKKSTLE